MSDNFFGNEYKSLFELGLFGENPAVKVVDNFEICPTNLAALVTALFETVMRTLPDGEQIKFEQKFNEALAILMKERFQYDITIRYPDDE